MAILKNNKHKEYTRFAAHCLEMVTIARGRESRSIQREMAAEWLRLADAVLRPSKSGT
jgi:hypothetical protein